MSNATRVRILRASDSARWYAKHIGETFEVVPDPQSEHYWLLASDVGKGKQSLIDRADCEVLP